MAWAGGVVSDLARDDAEDVLLTPTAISSDKPMTKLQEHEAGHPSLTGQA